jgi:AcrR family transcriptional regulator
MPKVIDESRVFEAAVDLFVTHGYEGTTTKDIAAAAGVNEATLFRRYGNKAQLMEAAIDRAWQDVPLASLDYTGDLERDLTAIVDAYVETNRLRGAIVPALLVELPKNDELRGAFRHAAMNIGHAAEILARHQREGRLRPEEPMFALMALIAPVMVNEMIQRAGVGLPPIRIDSHELVQVFLGGHAP